VTLTDNYRHGWKYIPHFVHTPFYCYAYAYAQIFVLTLFQKYQAERKAFLPKYFEMLSLGGSKAPEDIAKIAGLDAGMSVRMQGSFGNFKLDSAPEKQYLFLATGTGIAPIRSQILSALKEQKDTRPMHLLFGVLKREDLFWMEEWRGLEEQYPNFHAHISCLSGEADWHGETGSLQERLPRILRELVAPSVYICGAPVTVKELKEQCLTLGIPKSDVHFESYV
jgi:predicted ferric reductase